MDRAEPHEAERSLMAKNVVVVGTQWGGEGTAAARRGHDAL